jgi:APA family basic amino acid/polyamine antiporter
MPSSDLVRQLGVLSATALVVSNMIGVGIFTTTGFLAGDLGTPGLVIGIWIVGAALALAGAMCYSELAINFPRSGGEYTYLTEAWGPTWGFVDGWVSFFAGFSAPVAAAAIAAAAYAAVAFPGLAADPNNPRTISLGIATLQLNGTNLLAAGIVLVFTLINLAGIGQVAKLQNVLTALKLLVILALIVLGFTIGDGDWGHFSAPSARSATDGIFGQFAISLIFVFYGYSGWNAATYVAEEIREPTRTLPIALVFGTLIVAALYVLLNVLYIYANELSELTGIVAVAAKAATSLFGEGSARWFSLAMAISLLATVNAMSLIGPRVYLAMARDGAFFRSAARVHPTWKSPWIAVLAQGAAATVLILTGTFESLVAYIGFMLFLFSALAVLALFKLRRRVNWKPLKWVSFAYPLLPLVYVGMNVWVFIYFARMRNVEALWSLLTVATGAAVYHFYIRQRR